MKEATDTQPDQNEEATAAIPARVAVLERHGEYAIFGDPHTLGRTGRGVFLFPSRAEAKAFKRRIRVTEFVTKVTTLADVLRQSSRRQLAHVWLRMGDGMHARFAVSDLTAPTPSRTLVR
jgi:hypothetical protein